MSYSRVVVGTDGSPTAAEAVAAAAALAAGDGADLVVVAAFGEVGSPAEAGVDAESALAVVEAAAEEARAGGAASVTVRTGEGPAAEVLLTTAADVAADLIVVGSRGMTRPSRSTLGAVANTVSHRARCDVLVFHTGR